MEATIRLFRALPVEVKDQAIRSRDGKVNKELLSKTIKKGFIFSPEVVNHYSNYDDLIKMVEKTVGITAEKLNSSFHKSWNKVKKADIEQLVIEQILHYFTTYGFKKLGIYDKDTVYIPKEKLEIPETDIDNIELVVIKGYTKEELKAKLLDLLSLGIALGGDTINDVMDVATFVEFDEKDIEGIKNKEVKVALYDYLNLLPEDPIEFLRFIVYKATGNTLLIKSTDVIEEIRGKKNIDIIRLFEAYRKQYSPNRLAEIFYRFKPIFLAFRTNARLRIMINRIRKLAKIYHKPMQEDYLNSITAILKRGGVINRSKFDAELSRVNLFRKIRLAYALKFRTKDVDSILYRVRNGKGFATSFEFDNKDDAKIVLDVVLDSIIQDISKNVDGKKIYIPEHITYSLPATEKQFTGNFPSGTYVTVPKDIVFGIHWENVDRHTIDLDLSLMSPGGKFGWDAGYRNEERSILFSGDITDAPNGATELFYVRRQKKEAYILFVNYYNFSELKVPFKIIVAKEQVKNLRENYMVDPNNVISVAETKIDKQQMILGLVVTTVNECRFYFTETNIGMSITSDETEFAEHSRKYLFNFYEGSIKLNDILEKAGAEIVRDKVDSDIDLSPEALEKDTILGLLRKK